MRVVQTVVGEEMQENCYFVISEQNHCAVIDPGDDADRLLALLRRDHLCPQYILLTHGHFDHIGAVQALKRAFPSVQVAVGEKDAPMLGSIADNLAYMVGGTKDVYVITPDLLLREGDVLTVDELQFSFMETPGHTPGSLCIFCGDAFFTGDTVFHCSMGRTDFKGGSMLEMRRSLRRIAKLQGDYQMYPGHGPGNRFAQEKKENILLGRE